MISFYCSRSQICLRKWLGGSLRGVPPSSSSVSTATSTTGTGTVVASIATSENPQQVSTDCTSPCSTLLPMSSAADANDISESQQPEIPCDTVTEQKKNADNSDDNSNKVDNSSANEQRFCFIPFYASYAFFVILLVILILIIASNVSQFAFTDQLIKGNDVYGRDVNYLLSPSCIPCMTSEWYFGLRQNWAVRLHVPPCLSDCNLPVCFIDFYN